jgi:hypothetical protein
MEEAERRAEKSRGPQESDKGKKEEMASLMLQNVSHKRHSRQRQTTI